MTVTYAVAGPYDTVTRLSLCIFKFSLDSGGQDLDRRERHCRGGDSVNGKTPDFLPREYSARARRRGLSSRY